MKKIKKSYMAFAALLLAGAAVSLILVINRGAPSSDVASLKQQPLLEQASEEAPKLNTPFTVSNMQAVAQNEHLVLFINKETTEVALVDRQTGQTWYSNPIDSESDTLASPYEKNVLKSQLVLQYFDRQGNSYLFNSYEKSVAGGTFTLAYLEDGIRIIYTLGDASNGMDALPKYISKTRFEEKILSRLPEGTARYVQARYMEMKDRPGIMERLDQQVEKQLVLNKMLAAFLEAGYTEEDLAFDLAENGGGDGNQAEKPLFQVPLEYRLDGEELVVSIPFGEVTEGQSYIVRSIEVLPFFGAANTNQQGYMFVPDGSGSLIYLNNGKIKEEQYVQYVYGDDVNNNSRRRTMVNEAARMPVFGLKTEDGAYVAQITASEGISSISASISGVKNSYNNVFSTFHLRGEDWLELYTGNMYQDIKVLSEERHKGTGEIRYTMLTGKEASYIGMAKAYQKQLVEAGVLRKLEQANVPFYLDILGSYDHHAAFLGIPYKGISAMTTYKQAESIVEQLTASEVESIQLRYIGWFNEGIRHTTPSRIKLDSQVGSKQELKQLAQVVQQKGGKLYPDVAFNVMYEDDLAFTPSRDAARFVTREVVQQAPYNLSLNRMANYLGTYYILSPAKLEYFAKSFNKDYEKLELDGLALRDLGNVLASDYRVSRVIHRDTSKQLITQTLQKFDESYDLMVVGGHAYAWRYASHLIDVPFSASRFNVTDEVVPFYQMVLHGYLPYAGEAVNLSDEQSIDAAILQSIELGAYPHFTLTHKNSGELKFTHHTQYYSTEADRWIKEAARMYKDVKQTLAQVSNAEMIDRIVHRDKVVEVKYDNGISIIVNYNDEPVVVNGKTIDAKAYKVGGGRE